MRSSGWKFIVGFMLGAAVGAAVVLLFTPQSGEEIREKIRERSIGLQERLDERAMKDYLGASLPGDESTIPR